MKILIERIDGVSLMKVTAENLESALENWRMLHVGKYVSHKEVTDADLPVDRASRDAWKVIGGKVEVDTTKPPQPKRLTADGIAELLKRTFPAQITDADIEDAKDRGRNR